MKIDLVFLCILLFVLYHVYMSNKIESMADVSSDIKEAIKQVYIADVEAIRNLSNVATQLTNGGLTIPGDLKLIGDLKINGSLNIVPKGSIIAFNSDKAPEGWALCNGQNGTPDLRGRFIRMASADLQQEDGATGGFGPYVVGRKSNPGAVDPTIIGNSRTDSSSYIFKMNVGDYGGTDHQVLNVNEIPAHSHRVNDWASHNSGNSVHGNVTHRGSWYTREQNQNGGAEDYNALFDSDSSGAGGGWGHNNIPPFYVLVYIMKL
jgi:microcystin-dependent protein